MNNKLLLALTGLAIALGSCSSDTQTLPEMTVNFTGFEDSHNALEFFERQPAIAVETPGDTLMMPSFVRIVENDGIFYALDRNKTKVFGFDRNGKIRVYVSARGKSELEYIGIDDISWDSSKDCLAILAETKILYADKSGKIFESFPLSSYYNSFATCGEQTILANSTYANMKHSEFSLSIFGKDKKFYELLPTLPEYAPFCSVNGPSLTSFSDQALFSRLFDSNIYSITKNRKVTPKIHINYASSEFIPEEGKEYDCSDLFMNCLRSKQFYALTDIQQGNEFLTYKTNLSGLVILSKKSGNATLYYDLYDYDGKITLPQYIPVEHSDNLVFFYMDSNDFAEFAEKSGDQEMMKLAANVTPESNPIFLPYKLK